MSTLSTATPPSASSPFHASLEWGPARHRRDTSAVRRTGELVTATVPQTADFTSPDDN